MRSLRRLWLGVAILGVAGCAGLQFNDGPRPDALLYREAAPYLLVTVTADCISAASVLSLPGAPRSVSFKSGYGSANLSVALSPAGTITTVGQSTDTQVPATLTAIASLATAAGPVAMRRAAGPGAPTPPPTAPPPVQCKPTAKLYPFKANGEPDLRGLIEIPADRLP